MAAAVSEGAAASDGGAGPASIRKRVVDVREEPAAEGRAGLCRQYVNTLQMAGRRDEARRRRSWCRGTRLLRGQGDAGGVEVRAWTDGRGAADRGARADSRGGRRERRGHAAMWRPLAGCRRRRTGRGALLRRIASHEPAARVGNGRHGHHRRLALREALFPLSRVIEIRPSPRRAAIRSRLHDGARTDRHGARQRDTALTFRRLFNTKDTKDTKAPE